MSKSRIILPKPGLIADQPDKRDYREVGLMMSAMSAVAPDIKIKYVDWSDKSIPVRNQGSSDACVGFATTAAIELAYYKKLGLTKDLSERMAYEYARRLDRIPGTDHAGSTVRGGLKAANKFGICNEDYWQFNDRNKGIAKEGYLANAALNRIKSYHNIARTRVKVDTNDFGINVNDVARSLIKNPVVGGFYISERFSYIGSDGIVTPDMISGDYGHAMCIVGYNPNQKMFKIKNSWGSRWADLGYCYMPENLMRDCIVSAWTFDLNGVKKNAF